MTDIKDTLAERGKRYGTLKGHGYITQKLKENMRLAPKWPGLRDDMKEALDMIAHKIGRILNGDPFYHDSWHDIEGYARLVANTLLPVLNGETSIELNKESATERPKEISSVGVHALE